MADSPHLGGAPFNVVVNLRRLGRPTGLVTVVGTDDAGDLAIGEVGPLGGGSGAGVLTGRRIR